MATSSPGSPASTALGTPAEGDAQSCEQHPALGTDKDKGEQSQVALPGIDLLASELLCTPNIVSSFLLPSSQPVAEPCQKSLGTAAPLCARTEAPVRLSSTCQSHG